MKSGKQFFDLMKMKIIYEYKVNDTPHQSITTHNELRMFFAKGSKPLPYSTKGENNG